MSKKSKLLKVKLKLSKLEEKYSRGSPLNENEFQICMGEDIVKESLQVQKCKLIKETGNETEPKVMDNRCIETKIKQEREIGSNTSFKIGELLHKSSERDLLESSNQFKHIHFVSSSCDEHSSTDSERSRADEMNSENCFGKLDNVDIYKKYVGIFIDSDQEQTFGQDKLDDFESNNLSALVNVEFDLGISSAQENSSPSDSDYSELNNSSTSNSDCEQTGINKSDSYSAGILTLSDFDNSSGIREDTRTIIAKSNSKFKSFQNSCSKVISPTNDVITLENNNVQERAKTIYTASNNKPTCMMNLHENQAKEYIENRKRSSDPHLITQKDQNIKSLTKKRLRTKNRSTDHSKSVLKYVRPFANRPTLKSCKLIKYGNNYEILNEEESQSQSQKENNLSKFNILEGIFEDQKITASGYRCDDVIRQLLKIQIHLTRHFIESHHKIYLNCCQAVKQLNREKV